MRVVVKVGTFVLTNESGDLDEGYIRDLARQLSLLRREGHDVVLVTSGAIRVGRKILGLERVRTLPESQAAAAVGQAALMHLYERAFSQHGQVVAQILLTREDAADRRRYLNARNTFATLFNRGVIPIVNENDTVATEEICFGDNDLLAALVAALVEADILIMLSTVEGLFVKGELVREVERITSGIEEAGGGPMSDESRGGMRSKVEAAKLATRCGIGVVVAQGRVPDVVLKVAKGEELGTFFVPQGRRLDARRRWIAIGRRPKGRIKVHPEAVRRIVFEGKSLLPAGVLEVEEEFDAGDLVALVDREGGEFARGLTNYASEELRLIAGRKTSEISRILGREPSYDEVVHRDNLVVLAG